MQQLKLIQILLENLIQQISNRRATLDTDLERLGHSIESSIRHNRWAWRKLNVRLIDIAGVIGTAGQTLERDFVGVGVIDAADNTPLVDEGHVCDGRAGGNVRGDDLVGADCILRFGRAREDEGRGEGAVVVSAFKRDALVALVELGVWDVLCWLVHGGCR